MFGNDNAVLHSGRVFKTVPWHKTVQLPRASNKMRELGGVWCIRHCLMLPPPGSVVSGLVSTGGGEHKTVT